MMDKLVPIRSIVGGVDEHTDFQCMTGHTSLNQPPGGWPSLAPYFQTARSAHPAVPPFIGLEPKMQHKPYNAPESWLPGVANRSFRPEGNGKDDMVSMGVTLDRLADRKRCCPFRSLPQRC